MRKEPSDFFEVFNKEFEEMERSINQAMEDIKTRDWAKIPPDKVALYGWTFEMGPDRVPHWHEFGNVRPGDALPAPIREPLVSQVKNEANNETHLTIELPGVEKNAIRVDAASGTLHVKAGSGDRAFETSVDLPDMNPDTTKATYRNGVLDITIKHDKHARADPRVVPVE